MIGNSAEEAAKNALRVKNVSGQPVVRAAGDKLPFANKSVDEVFLNNAPLDKGSGFFGPSFTTNEINRILKDGGKFILNGKSVQ